MPRSRFSGGFSSPKVDLIVDMGNPFLNLTLDGFLKIDTVQSLSSTISLNFPSPYVAASKVAAEETYHVVKRGSVSNHSFEHSVRSTKITLVTHFAEHVLKKMCKESAYWGSVAGVYVGMEYGAERIRGTRDWKNAMIGGALTGALVSAASNNNRDKVVMDAITGVAIATAAEFLNYLT
ncbi:hypothetical protein RJ639_045575 [Escallonia herrerae]|uniref:Uncharacterized protein n=1 Tax=Escallonia herrerae TaxID=1293975 RepID=A0AA89B357_9ASTE|nr:hypothetical protein RJ639_045575 [Escallonia herrerae]